MSIEGFSNEQPPPGEGPEQEGSDVSGSSAGGPPDELLEVSGSASGGPPDELLEEMGLAAEVYERLAARGRELRFRLDPPTGRVTVEVHDLDGKLLYTIPPARALEIAGGEDVDEV